VSDVLRWLPRFKVFLSTEIAPDLPRPPARLASVIRALRDGGCLKWKDFISSKIIVSREGLLELVPTLPSVSTTLLPTTHQWSFVLSPKSKQVPVVTARPKDVRCLWHTDLPLVLVPPTPPLVVPLSWRLNTQTWRRFWSLALPHKATTPWWRLLHDSVGFKAKLYRWNPSFCPSPLCPICGEVPEDSYHFVVGCPVKSRFWHDVIAHIGLSHLVATDLDVWSVLLSFSTSSGMTLTSSQLCLFGAAFSTMWSYYWLCFFNHTTWSTPVALTMFINRNTYLLSSSYTEFDLSALNYTRID